MVDRLVEGSEQKTVAKDWKPKQGEGFLSDVYLVCVWVCMVIVIPFILDGSLCILYRPVRCSYPFMFGERVKAAKTHCVHCVGRPSQGHTAGRSTQPGSFYFCFSPTSSYACVVLGRQFVSARTKKIRPSLSTFLSSLHCAV